VVRASTRECETRQLDQRRLSFLTEEASKRLVRRATEDRLITTRRVRRLVPVSLLNHRFEKIWTQPQRRYEVRVRA
jgi:hypothetical protein